MKVRIAETPDPIRACFPVMRHLRTHLDDAEGFVQRVLQQRRSGYRLAALLDVETPVAVAGFRLGENLAWGRFLYVDDLVTSPEARSRGCGKQLIDWLLERARTEGCDELHLDSGKQRLDAHRFYEREGLEARSLHFQRGLSK